jgi:hypothetical protein
MRDIEEASKSYGCCTLGVCFRCGILIAMSEDVFFFAERFHRRAADLSGWLEPDLVQMPRFASTIFTREWTSFHNQK